MLENTQIHKAVSLLKYTGTLTKNGQARHKIIDEIGNTVPVLILSMTTDSPFGVLIFVEQNFPLGAMDECKAEAKRYQKNQRITVQTPLSSHRLNITASCIQKLPPEVLELFS